MTAHGLAAEKRTGGAGTRKGEVKTWVLDARRRSQVLRLLQHDNAHMGGERRSKK